MKTCSIQDCNRSVVAKGLCASHYQTQRMAAIRAEARMVSRPCARCGKDLAGKRLNAVYCSRACKDAAIEDQRAATIQQRLSGRICRQCGGPITSSSGKALTCSRACGEAWRNNKRRTEQLAAWNARKQPCPQCGNEVPESRWGAIYCSDRCNHNFQAARWREKSPGYNRKRLYGITPEEHAALFAEQGERCAICGSAEPGGKGWHVDHDHVTGKVRGILCHKCNVGLGNFNDDPSRLRAAIDYIER